MSGRSEVLIGAGLGLGAYRRSEHGRFAWDEERVEVRYGA